jgi:predicted N-formylglutamate amidohydrolase
VTDESLVVREADGVELSWNRGLTESQIGRRVESYHGPYHAEVDRLIGRRSLRGIDPLLLAIHSFTDSLNGRSRPFDIGVLFEHHGDVARRLTRSFRKSGMQVRYNQPYSGMAGMMYSADRHGTHHRIPCLEIEVNQRLMGRSVARIARALIPGIGKELARRALGAKTGGESGADF